MPNADNRLPPSKDKHGVVIPDVPETDAPDYEIDEGQLPGMPISSDPLGAPLPRPAPRERKPLD